MLRNLLKDSKEKTPPLAFHTMTMCESVICIYGGMTAKDEVSGDVYFIKIHGKNIIKAEYEKNKALFPKPRHSHSADYDSNSKRLFIFGGHSLEHPSYLNQLCVLDLKNFPTIVFQSIKSIDITPRCMHTTFLFYGKLYIYGGYGMTKNTNELKILNDFFYLEIATGKIAQVTSKGGNEMLNKLYKAIPLERNDEVAFFTQNLSSFQVFNLETEVFTKIEIKFEVPQIREYFTLNLLQDGRLVVFGGCRNDDSFRDLYYLINYTYDQKVFWMWSRMDLLGDVHEGYSGHCSLVLENNHILFHGGTQRAFDWRFPENTKHEALFSNRVQLFDIYTSFEWLHELKSDFDNTAMMNNNLSRSGYSGQNDNDIENVKLPLRKTLFNTVLHILAYIPKDAEDYHAKMLLHGGEREDQIISRHHVYNLTESRWVNVSTEDDENFCPQLKGHAWSNYFLLNAKRKEHYIIVTGGITIEHVGSSCLVVKSEKAEKVVTNTLKQSCPCTNENISQGIYAYRQNFWNTVKLIGDNASNASDHLKRYGHSMAYIQEKMSLYMICGFIQYKGYVVQLCKLEIKKEVDFFKKKKKNLENPKLIDLECKFTEISLDDYNIKGRMHATLGVSGSNLILFGGIRDDSVLNDMYVITLPSNSEDDEIEEKPTVILVQNDPKVILPRFGSSCVTFTDDFNRNIARVLVFGGSFQPGEKMIPAMTNELIVFQFRFSHVDNSINIEGLIPTVYGFSEKRLFHSAVVHDGNMYIYGGLHTRFMILNIPHDTDYNVESTLNEYVKDFPPLTFDDWEQGNTSKNKEMKRRAKEAENLRILKGKNKHRGVGKSEINEINENASGILLNNDDRSMAEKSINLNYKDDISIAKNSFLNSPNKARSSIKKSLVENPNSHANSNFKKNSILFGRRASVSPDKIDKIDKIIPLQEEEESVALKDSSSRNTKKETVSFRSKLKNPKNAKNEKNSNKESLNSSVDGDHSINTISNTNNANLTTNQNLTLNDNSINILIEKENNSVAEDENALINIVGKHRKASYIFAKDADDEENEENTERADITENTDNALINVVGKHRKASYIKETDNAENEPVNYIYPSPNPSNKITPASLILGGNESRKDNSSIIKRNINIPISSNISYDNSKSNPLNLLGNFPNPGKIMDMTVDSVSKSNVSSSVVSKKGFSIKKKNKSGNKATGNKSNNWDQDYD